MCCFKPLCEIIAGVPRLFDLVSVSDPKLRLAFWYALRHTLVADNLDQASRIAYGTRFSRVVTMAGQLIAGARWGGGWCASAVLALFVPASWKAVAFTVHIRRQLYLLTCVPQQFFVVLHTHGACCCCLQSRAPCLEEAASRAAAA